MAPAPRRPRPLSSATDLTDCTDQTIEADPDNRSLNSADFDADTQSLSSDIYDYVCQYGRTYPSFAGAYPFPNDEKENDRLKLQHILFKARLNNRNIFAPLHNLPLKRPKRVLDIGCGTGHWCMEVARAFPRTVVEGIDLSPIQPSESEMNCYWFIDDIRRKVWWRCTKPYDYIHTRMMLGIFGDFREIIQKGFNNLEPGGYMESQELYPTVYCDDGTMPDDWPLLMWSKEQDKAAMYLGTPLRIANKLKMWYEQAGFVDVKEYVYSIPITEWAKEDIMKMFGKFMAINMQDGIYGWTADYFTRAFGWTTDQIHVECARVHNSLNDRTVHAYYKIYIVHGRKPLPGELPSKTPKPEHWPTEFTSRDDDESSMY